MRWSPTARSCGPERTGWRRCSSGQEFRPSSTHPGEMTAADLGIERPTLKRLYQDWLDRRRGRAMPARADFDVLDLGYIVGDLNLLDVLYAPLRFRFRVHGTHAVSRLGFDLTGKTVDDYPDSDYRAVVREHFSQVVEAKAPKRIARDPFRRRNRMVLRWEGLVLPLSADGARVDMLMVGLSVE